MLTNKFKYDLIVKRMIANKSYLLLLLSCIVFEGSCQFLDTAQKNKFEHDISQALHLKFINRDSGYGSPYLSIFNDTLVYITRYFNDDPRVNQYFIQSISRLNNKIQFDKPESISPTNLPDIDDYQNGCLYYAQWGSANMLSVCSDGKVTKFENTGTHGFFYSNKVMLYKHMGILITPKNIVAFNLSNQQLLWKFNFLKLADKSSAIVDNKLYFTECLVDTRKKFTNIYCFNLDNMKLEWKRVLTGQFVWPYEDLYQRRQELHTDSGHILIPAENALYALDNKNGKIKGVVPWKGYFETFTSTPIFKVKNDTLYVSDNQNLYCKNVLTNKVIWAVKNLRFHSFFHDKVIGYTKESDFYFIINKATGEIENKVAKTQYNDDLIVIDNYVMINRMALYK